MVKMKLWAKSTQNCHNAEKVLSFVAPSGEQELTLSYEINTVSLCCIALMTYVV